VDLRQVSAVPLPHENRLLHLLNRRYFLLVNYPQRKRTVEGKIPAETRMLTLLLILFVEARQSAMNLFYCFSLWFSVFVS
jgi:hypothetical protein